MAWVQKQNTKFTLNNNRFIPFGASIYGGEGSVQGPTYTTRLQQAKLCEFNTMRLINYLNNSSATNTEYNETKWQYVDQAIASARDEGMKILLDLSDISRIFSARNIAFADRDYSPVYQWILNRVNTVNGLTYKNDDTIAIVSIAGEAQTTAGLVTMYTNAARALRAKGYQGLICSGAIEYYSSVIEQVYTIPELDCIASHPYQNNVGNRDNGNGFVNNAKKHQGLSRKYNKPWFLEEFGWWSSNGDSEWSIKMESMYKLGCEYESAGFMFWNFAPMTAAPGGEDYNIYSSHTDYPLTTATVKRFAEKIGRMYQSNAYYNIPEAHLPAILALLPDQTNLLPHQKFHYATVNGMLRANGELSPAVKNYLEKQSDVVYVREY